MLMLRMLDDTVNARPSRGIPSDGAETTLIVAGTSPGRVAKPTGG